MRPPVLLSALACALIVVAGCGGPSIATPSDAVGATTTPSPPHRPRPISLAGRDPCALLTPADEPAFDIQQPGQESTNPTFGNAEQCSYGTDVAGLRITLVTDEGIDAWTSGQRNVVVGAADPVLGFPAVTTMLRDNIDPGNCDVLVDVAAGQYLDASVEIIEGRESKVPSPCTYAHRLAEAAMRTLLHGG